MAGVPIGRWLGAPGRGALYSVLALVTAGQVMLADGPAAAAQAAAGHGTGKARESAPTLCTASASRPPFFIDEAQQPPVAAMDGPHHYTLTAAVHHTHHFSSAWPAVKTLAYSTANAPMDYFGPTIVTEEGRPVDVKLVNDLPESGTPVFPTFPVTNNDNTLTLHHHGGLQDPDSDGVPAPLGREIEPGHSFTYHYPNTQPAAPLFYHDHDDGNTGPHLYAGLIGYSPETDAREPHFGLPSGDFAKTYALMSASFDSDEQLCLAEWSAERPRPAVRTGCRCALGAGRRCRSGSFNFGKL